MARVSLILGESASGKTTSGRTLPAKNTVFVNPVDKDLPWEGSESDYRPFSFKTGKGNIYATKKTVLIFKFLKYISDNRPEVKVAVLDDNQYVSLFTFMNRIDEKSFEKFNEIAVNMVGLVESCKTLRKDLQIYIMQHIEGGEDVDGNKQIQAKTMGKFVKEKVTYEGLFTLVLLADKTEDDEGNVEHFFWTRKGNSTVKSPMGMFKDQKIPNDLYAVAKRVESYYKTKKPAVAAEE